jgi:DNA mismatch repair protein MutL
MPQIRVLPEKVANQIAAGEVVERPAAVVKELLENSLDAGATRVSVEFRNGGKSFIAVEDNGCGMTPDQALLSLEMHATSKIRTADDLNNIHTFGFRGEAVPSIASVSRFTLRTRTADALAGTEVFVNASKLIHQHEIGMAPGTRIEVANLFHPVPARLKFLKTENTEAAHITRLTRLYAVAQAHVGFVLTENGDEIFRSPSENSLLDRVREIWGNQLAAELVELVPVETTGMRLHGLLGKPGSGRMTRQEMVTIVNGRPVDSRTLAYALVESYHTLLPKGRYPLAFLFLDIDPHWVDVNVHPAKREIRFRDEPRVRQFVITEVLRHLDTLNPGASASAFASSEIPKNGQPPPTANQEQPPSPPTATNQGIPATGNFQGAKSESHTSYTSHSGAPATPAAVPPPAVPAAAFPSPGTPASAAAAATASAPALPSPAAAFRLNWRLAGRLADGLFLFETPDGLVVFNLRAAHERIWYERVLRRFAAHEMPPAQQLLLPIPLELEPLSASTLREHQAALGEVGFDINEFGRNFFRIHAVPDWLGDTDATQTLRDILAGLGRRGGEFQRVHLLHDFLARLAAERAGRIPGTASDDAVLAAVRELFLCRQPTVCPGGKPIFFELSRAELSRRLGT